jgi:long-chain acyl-CoA synthetase
MSTGGFLTKPLKRAALMRPNATATIDGERRRTWAEVHDRVPRLAAALRELGITTGYRVAVLAFNSDRYFELHFALPWAGAAIVPMNTRLAPAEIEFMMRDAGCLAIFVDETHLPVLDQMPEVKAGLKAIILMSDSAAPGCLAYEDLIAGSAPAEDLAPGGSNMAGIFYTSGSSGRSKGVVLSHDNLVQNAVNALIEIGYDKDSVYLHAAPMFHLTDGMSTFSLTMIGGTHVFIPKFDARQVLETVQKHGVTNLCLVPTMIEMLVTLAEKEPFDLSTLKQFQFGASPMPEATLERAIRLWPDMLYLHGWGMTELSPLGTTLPFEYRDPKVAGKKLKSCGVPALNEEIRIVDENGNDVPLGVVGEMIVRGPMVMQGYWNMPEETAKTVRNGWMHTGDAAYRDEEGLIYIADRLKDMIISGGENVYSTEVENVIGRYPGVAQVAVIGLPHPKWGESVHAVIIPEPGVEIDTDDVTRFVKSQIAGYKAPRSWSIRTEPLPLTSSGKVSKRLLREEYRREMA